jgi:hypothetical protein
MNLTLGQPLGSFRLLGDPFDLHLPADVDLDNARK